MKSTHTSAKHLRCLLCAGALAVLGTMAASAAPAAGGPPLAGDVVDASGKIVPAAYRSIAAQFSSDAGISYRYGPNAAHYGVTDAGLPKLYERESNYSRCDRSGKNCLTAWQVGGPRNYGDANNDQAAAGKFSTNQANVAFVADNPQQRVGVTDLQVSGFEFNTLAQSPQLPWQMTMAANAHGGLDSFTVAQYRAAGIVTGSPVAMDRCGGRTGFCASSVIAFQNGVLGSAGSNTARNLSTTRLAPNKVPTAVAMTNNSEFALVTVWDTAELKGQVAVVALAGLCDGCRPENPAAFYLYWDEWMGVYPGLPNMGNVAFMKVLGYVDLPSDMKAPTGIAVTTGLDQFKTTVQGRFVGFKTPLTVAANRQSFVGNGGNSDKYAKSAVAVVISKSEQKAVFIDLKPLFTYVNNMYFAVDQNRFTDTVVKDLGQGATQWPHTFAFKPEQTPKVIKTVSLDARPTAVRTTVFGKAQRAWIATQENARQKEGSLRIYSLGNYAIGGDASPADIAEKGRVAIGRNPTSLATSKAEPDDRGIEPINEQVLVASRGDRKIQWVRFAADGNSGKVARTLQDVRMIDPLAVEEVENFANAGYLVSIADYDGRKLHNYRYGPVVFADRGPEWACQPPAGCPVRPTGSLNIEYGGGYTLQGRPFQINTSNVP